jgi:hypothetical protein
MSNNYENSGEENEQPVWLDGVINAIGQVLSGIIRCGAIGGYVPLFTSNFEEANERKDYLKQHVETLCQGLQFRDIKFDETQFVIMLMIPDG